MRLILLCAATLGFAVHATSLRTYAKKRAQAKISAKKPRVKARVSVLSYQELMSLSPQKRQEYLENLRRLMVHLESRQGYYEVAQVGANYSDEIARWMQQLAPWPQASAQMLTLNNGGRPYWKNGAWTCDPKYMGTDVAFDKSAGTCTQYDTSRGTAVENNSANRCPSGFTSIPDSSMKLLFIGPDLHGNLVRCVPQPSWNVLTPARQKALQNREYLPDGFFDGKKDPHPTWTTVAGLQPGANDGGRPVAAPASSSPVAAAAPAPAPASLSTSTSTSAPAATPAAAPGNPSAPDKPDAGAGDSHAGAPALANAAAPTPAASDCGAGYACSQFSATDVQAAEKAFRADRGPGSDVCIWGGFFSTYKTTAKRKGGCRPVTHGPDTNKPVCKANQTLCNPVLFCLAVHLPDPKSGKTDSFAPTHCEPFGRKDGYDITNRCYNWYHAAVTSGKADFSMTLKGKKRAQNFSQVPVSPCGPGDNIDVGGAHQEDWDTLKKDLDAKFTTWCAPNSPSDSPAARFQALFCNECQVMADILASAKDSCATETTDASAAPSTEDKPADSQQ